MGINDAIGKICPIEWVAGTPGEHPPRRKHRRNGRRSLWNYAVQFVFYLQFFTLEIGDGDGIRKWTS